MNTLIVIILLLILALLIWHIWQIDKQSTITPEYLEKCMEVSIEKQFGEHDRTYKQTIEKCAEIILYIDYKFIRKYYPNELGKGFTLYDLVAKYGLESIMDKWEDWEKCGYERMLSMDDIKKHIENSSNRGE